MPARSSLDQICTAATKYSRMEFSYQQLTLLSLVGVVTVYAIHTISTQRRMKGAKPPPGPKGMFHQILLAESAHHYSQVGRSSAMPQNLLPPTAT